MKLLIILLFGQITVATANVYSCKSPSTKPIKSTKSIKSELILTTSQPIIESNELNVRNLDTKSPFLIYYAVDSIEEFMQYSVRFEVAKLQESCRRNDKIQFIAFINSLYVEQNSFIMCKNQNVSIRNFSQFPELDKKLRTKRKYFSSDKQKENDYGPLDYLVALQETNRSFWNYPLAHPDFLYNLVNFTISNKDIFPNGTYAAFLNLKSHGSETNVLAGLHSCQEKAKNLSSKAIIEMILTRSEINVLKNLKTIEKVEESLKTYERIISKLDLGSIHGVGSFSHGNTPDRDRLGNDRLSVSKDGLGAISGLGSQIGLEGGSSFGTDQSNLGWVLRDIFESGSDRSLGFLVLESCETNRNPHLYHKYISNVYGYFTAKKSLWYRNLNWWEILEKAKGKTVNMVNILREETAKIPNIEVVTK